MAKIGNAIIARVAAIAPGRAIMPVAFPAAVMMILTEPAKIGRSASVIRIAPRFSSSVPASAEDIMNGGSVKKRRSMLAFVIESDQIGRLAARGTR